MAPSGPVGRWSAWADGLIVLRERHKISKARRLIKIRQPFATIGRDASNSIRIEDSGVEDQHAFFFLDERGLFGVDLRTARGTRFAGAQADSSWLGTGDTFEIGDHVYEVAQLRVDGRSVEGPLVDDDPLGSRTGPNPIDVSIRPEMAPSPHWVIGSSLVFIGASEACAVHVDDPDGRSTCCALLIQQESAYLINLHGSHVEVCREPVGSVTRLIDGDVIEVGPDALKIFINQPDAQTTRPTPPSTLIAPRTILEPFLDDSGEIGRSNDREDIQQVQAETAVILKLLFERIEQLDAEMRSLRSQLNGLDHARESLPRKPKADPIRLDLIDPGDGVSVAPEEATSWLVDRIQQLDEQRGTVWRDLLAKLKARNGLS